MISTTQGAPKVIHIAKIRVENGLTVLLYLRQLKKEQFTWCEERQGVETETAISAATIEEALKLAVRKWKANSFRFIICGFRYTLPERDEHGINALFHQMCASYSAMNGVYYDEELGNNCFVQNASNEALEIWAKLRCKKVNEPS